MNTVLSPARSRAIAFAVLLVLGSASLGACSNSSPADHARSQIGRPYAYGAASPATGFDCSGLTSWAWRQAGRSIPRTSGEQYRATRRISIGELRPGDLVFYGFGSKVTHVAMYVGGGLIVHAQKPGTTVREDRLGSWWTTNRIGYGRV